MEELEGIVWEINGCSLIFDMTEAGSIERYDAGIEYMRNNFPEEDSNLSSADYIRAYCKAFRNFYDIIFGKGAAEKIFSSIPESMRIYNKIYLKFLVFISGQKDNLYKDFAETRKFLPK